MSKQEIKDVQKKLKAQDFEAALQVLQNLSQEDTYQSLLLLGFTYFSLKNYDQSLSAYARAIRAHDENETVPKTHAYKGVQKVYDAVQTISSKEHLLQFLEALSATGTLNSKKTPFDQGALVGKTERAVITSSVNVFGDYKIRQEVLVDSGVFKEVPLHMIFDERMEMGGGIVCELKNKALGELVYLSNINDRAKTTKFLQKARTYSATEVLDNWDDESWFDTLRSKLIPLSEYEHDLILGGVIESPTPEDLAAALATETQNMSKPSFKPTLSSLKRQASTGAKNDDRVAIEAALQALTSKTAPKQTIFEVINQSDAVAAVKEMLAEYYIFIEPQRVLILTSSPVLHFRAFFELDKRNEALEKIKKSSHSGQDVQIVQKILENNTEISPDLANFYACIYAGRHFLETGNIEAAKKPLLTAAKLRPGFWVPFSLLGKMYFLQNQQQRSEKCFRKALQLEPKANIAGLVEILVERGAYEEAIELMQAAVERKSARFEHWAMFRLGLVKLVANDGDINNAIFYLQTALTKTKVLDTSVIYLALGDAYLLRGSYDSAKRCFTKMLAESQYAAIRLAYILIQTGDFPEAEATLTALSDSTDQKSVLIETSLLECYLLLAQEARAQNIVNRARDVIDTGLARIKLLESNEVSSKSGALFKKLKADFLLESTFLPEADVRQLSMKSLELYQNLEPDPQANLYNQAICNLRAGDNNQAINLLLAAVELGYSSKTSRFIWNALGVAYFMTNQGKHAQDAFVRSLHIDPTLSQSWANLGFLYLKQGQLQLANRAFGNAQSADPEDGFAWIGQALVAKFDQGLGDRRVGLVLEQVRHSQLSCHQNWHTLGGLEYAHCVMLGAKQTQLLKHEWARLAAPIHKHTQMFPADPVAKLIHAQILYKQGLLNSTDIAIGDSKFTDPLFKTQLLLQLGTHKPAIDTLLQLETKAAQFKNFLLCLCYYSSGMTENALEILDEIIEAANSEKSKVSLSKREQLTMLQARIEFRGQSETAIDDAATTLFEFYQEASAENQKLGFELLACLGAIGVQSENDNLVSLVLNEITEEDVIERILLEGWLLRKHPEKLQAHLLKAVHCWPHRSELWMLLSRGCTLPSMCLGSARVGRSLDPTIDTEYFLSLLGGGLENREVQREVMCNPLLLKNYV